MSWWKKLLRWKRQALAPGATTPAAITYYPPVDDLRGYTTSEDA